MSLWYLNQDYSLCPPLPIQWYRNFTPDWYSLEQRASISIAPQKALFPQAIFQHFLSCPSYQLLRLRSGLCGQQVRIPFCHPDPRLYLRWSMLRILGPRSPLPQFICKTEVPGLRKQAEKIWGCSQHPHLHWFIF